MSKQHLGILPVTLPKTNIAPWKYAESQEIHIQTIDFQDCENVKFSGG